MLKQLCYEFHKGEPYKTGESIEVAFARTLVMDNRRYPTMIALGDNPSRLLHGCWLEAEQNIDDPSQLRRITSIYIDAAKIHGYFRNLFITESGYIGLGPWDLRQGDAVAVFDGAESPCVLRQADDTRSPKAHNKSDKHSKLGNEEKWEILGDCYLHGFMDNEALDPKYAEKQQTFWII